MTLGQQELGRRIRQARDDADLTQAELADALGLGHPQSISRYERGETEVPQKRLRRIAEVTGKPLGFFLEDEISADPPAEDGDGDLRALALRILEELQDLRAQIEERPARTGRRSVDRGSSS